MRLIITASIEKKAKKIWLTFDELYDFIKSKFSKEKITLENICSPIKWTTAYKGYISKLKRTVIFYKDDNGLLYITYIWNKQDEVGKNITKRVIKNNFNKWLDKIERDIDEDNIKLRHF